MRNTFITKNALATALIGAMLFSMIYAMQRKK